MSGRRYWFPCRVCGADHTNPRSSGICPPCGRAESAANEAACEAERRAYRESPFGRFMDLSEDERWQQVFDFMQEHGG